MTRAPRLSARMRALNEAAEIAEDRARRCFDAAQTYTAAVCWELARLIRERMQNRRANP